jgi:benzoyl-CoA-dihydrodiol lyase
VAAVTGACAGGGYELGAGACDRIVMVDDRSSIRQPAGSAAAGRAARHRRPHAGDGTNARCGATLAHIFCPTSEGVRADRAKDWKLIDACAKPQQFAALTTMKSRRCARNRPAPVRSRASS